MAKLRTDGLSPLHGLGFGVSVLRVQGFGFRVSEFRVWDVAASVNLFASMGQARCAPKDHPHTLQIVGADENEREDSLAWIPLVLFGSL